MSDKFIIDAQLSDKTLIQSKMNHDLFSTNKKKNEKVNHHYSTFNVMLIDHITYRLKI